MHLWMGKWRFLFGWMWPFWPTQHVLSGLKVTWWKAVDVCYCVVKKLELSSEYFGSIAKIGWAQKKLKTYSWKLKIIYCKLKMYSWKLKMVYWKLKTIANKFRSAGPNLVSLLAMRCLYGGTSELRSTGPNWVPLLATGCLYQGVHLKTKDSPL